MSQKVDDKGMGVLRRFQNFSKVTSIVIVHCEFRSDLTFENFAAG